MVLDDARSKSWTRQRRDDEHRNPATAPDIRCALVPQEEQRRRREVRRVEDRRDDLAEPRVASGYRAVVHVRAQVRRDPHEFRHGACDEIAPERGQRHDVAAATRRVRDDVRVVNEWIVMGRVQVLVGRRAWRRHAFHVCLPAAARCLDLIGNVGGRDDAAGAVVREKRIAARERHVIGQTGMRHARVTGSERVPLREAVHIGRARIVDHVAVLHRDDVDVREVRQRRGGLCANRHRRGEREAGERRGRDDRLHQAPL